MPEQPIGAIDRRTLLVAAGAASAVAGAAVPARAQDTPPAPAGTVGKSIVSPVLITECTNTAVTASPDGSQLAMDLLNALWIMDIAGGQARRLTDDFGEVAQPDWSPDGTRIIFQSYRSGNWQIWSISPDGFDLKQLTDGPFDAREPRFSPDGRTIAFSSDRSGRYAIHLLDETSGAITALTNATGQESEPCWSPDGEELAFVSDGNILMASSLSGQLRKVTEIKTSADRFRPSEIHSPSYTPDGEITYFVLQNGATRLLKGSTILVENEDLFMFRPAWLAAGGFVYASGGKVRRAPVDGGPATPIDFSAAIEVKTPQYVKRQRDFTPALRRSVTGISAPVLSPDGKSIAFRAVGDIWLMSIGDAPRKLIDDQSFKCDPAFSPDGSQLSYSSDRSGKLDIWIRDITSGTDRQLTTLSDAAVSASWSQDGKKLAFLDQNGSLHTVDVSSGEVTQLFEPLWEPGRPSWGPRGATIAYAAFKPYSARFREGLSEFLTVDTATGKGSYAPLMPDRSLGTRGDDGPVWSPDGKSMAFVFASTLWTVPVGEDGQFVGKPRQLNHEVTDAPSWSGDSSKILYLSNGRLRLIPATGGRPSEVPFRLTWANAMPPARSIIRAGRLWDGYSDTYSEKVDIFVSENKIEAVRPSSADPAEGDVKFIDASDKTVIPGLVDMHTHRQMQGYSYGNRQGLLWLVMGVTSTRSPGCPAYQMAEEREAVDSGKRIGPRHFATGEAIDGSRIFYNFMRPVTESGQLALEMSRARALEYDMVKTYVRLPLQMQAEAIEQAHRAGQHVSGHYHYPALNFGADCMEHLGATSRLGYSRTVSPAGAGYQDVIAPFNAAKAGRTPTLFMGSVLLAEDHSLLEDRRVRTLYPSWEYKRLKERVEHLASIDRTPLLEALEKNVEQVRAMLAGGGRVLSGTDAPIDFMSISLHLNLRSMVKFGVSPLDALRTATSAPGEFLTEPLGLIAPGYYADLVMLDGDPLAHIEDAAAVSQVMKNGETYSVDQLLEPFAGAAGVSADAGTVRNKLMPSLASVDADHWWHQPDFLEQCRSACCADHAA